MPPMTPWVIRLIVANVAVFLVTMTSPRLADALVLYPPEILAGPWTIVTYMFLHAGLGHIFWNMLALFFFGPRLEDRLGSTQFAILYLVSGITGGLLSCLFPAGGYIVGASGAVFG